MAKRRVSKKKVSILIVILVVIVIGALAFFFLNKSDSTVVKKKTLSTIKIKGYDYTLREDATGYQKKLFKELKSVLEASDVSEEEYASLVTKLFVTDFFNLDNKTSKSDVGGVQFVYKDYRDDFKKYASASIYKSVLSNVYGDRKQDLPVVSSVSTQKSESESFKYGDNTDDKALKVNFDITYKEDLGYQDSGVVYLIHNGKKLEVAKMEEAIN